MNLSHQMVCEVWLSVVGKVDKKAVDTLMLQASQGVEYNQLEAAIIKSLMTSSSLPHINVVEIDQIVSVVEAENEILQLDQLVNENVRELKCLCRVFLFLVLM